MSNPMTAAGMRPDADVVRVPETGRQQRFPPTPPMSDAAPHLVAMAHPDARALTDAEWEAARREPRATAIRRGLGLTQEEFAERFQIPLGTLREWEHGKTTPGPSARAYLRAIAGVAAAVQRALQAGPLPD